MRRGELLGLTWSDVDLDRGTLAIRRTRITTASGTAEVAPKTARGVRTVELDRGTISVLRQNRAQQAGDRLAAGSAWQETGLVFVWSDGRGPSPYWISHRFKVLVRESRLPSMSLHGLRHSHATALLAADIHPKIVQERLGHHSTAFTMDVYSSVLPSMQREAVERLADEVG